MARVRGRALRCTVSVEESSQFASALILSQRIGGWQVERHRRQRGRAALCRDDPPLLDAFPWGGGTYEIEPDASGASYFWGAHWLLRDGGGRVRVAPSADERHAARPAVPRSHP